jgi:hypothetical protein
LGRAPEELVVLFGPAFLAGLGAFFALGMAPRRR